MLRLFTTIFDESCPKRMAEYAECLRRNLACGELAEVCLMVEGGGSGIPASAKIRTRRIQSRPTYADYFCWINEVAEEDDVSLIANGDVWFDDHLKLFARWAFPARTLLALSRWDVRPDGPVVLYDHNDSQDSWMVRGGVHAVMGDFPLGIPRCDNRIAAEFERAGYQVLNPSFSIKSYHLHAGPPRLYDATKPNMVIAPPYKYVWPHNLFGPLGTACHRVFGQVPLGYRIDRRRLARTFPCRLWRKVLQMAARPGSCRHPDS